MERSLLWTAFWVAPISAYALAPAAPARLSAVVLLATTMLAMRTTFEGSASRGEKAVALALAWLALAVGTAISLVLSNSTLSTTFSASSDIVAALFLYTFTTTVIPIVGIGFLAAAPASGTASSFTRIFLAGLFIALGGSVYEHVSGIGRVGWWIRASEPGDAYALEWAQRGGGPVLVDFVIGASAFALAQLVWVSSKSGASAGALEGDDMLQHDASEEDPGATRWKSRRKPVYFLLGVILLALLAPLLPDPQTRLVHPSPSDLSYVYPPIHVGCVSPPFEGKHGLTIDDWLKETIVFAGRGVKVLSWSEGAVRLERGADHEPQEGEDAWLAFGEDEKSLLRRVGEICDMYKVHILATYSVPPATDSARHQLLNVATLVGPRDSSSHQPDDVPNIIFTTTKHHPVPFVESYSHVVRALPELGSVVGALPLARIAVPHSGHHTPSPHLTPLQTITVSAAICQDAAYPALASSLLPVGGGNGGNDQPRAVQLILNPSATPASLSGFGALSLAQARARAIEHSAFLLRCDAPSRHAAATGAGTGSILIDPKGRVRLWTGSGSADSGSWDAAIRPEEASNDDGRSTTIWTRMGGTSAHAIFGAESRFLLLLATMTLLVRIVGGGEARRRLLDTDWRDVVGRIREKLGAGWRRARSSLRGGPGGIATGRFEGAREQGREEHERLIEVD